jgi:hypothetical protein
VFGGGCLLYSASHHKQPQVRIRQTSGVWKMCLPIKLIGRRCVSREKCESSRRIALSQGLAGFRQRGSGCSRAPTLLPSTAHQTGNSSRTHRNHSVHCELRCLANLNFANYSCSVQACAANRMVADGRALALARPTRGKQMTGRVSSSSAIHFRHQNSCLRKAIWVRHWALTSKSPALRAWQYSRVSSATKMTAYIASTHQPVAVQLIMGLRGSPNAFLSRLNKRSDAFQRVASDEQETYTGLGSAQDYWRM